MEPPVSNQQDLAMNSAERAFSAVLAPAGLLNPPRMQCLSKGLSKHNEQTPAAVAILEARGTDRAACRLLSPTDTFLGCPEEVSHTAKPAAARLADDKAFRYGGQGTAREPLPSL